MSLTPFGRKLKKIKNGLAIKFTEVKTMTKAELINAVAEKGEFTKKDAEKAVKAFIFKTVVHKASPQNVFIAVSIS